MRSLTTTTTTTNTTTTTTNSILLFLIFEFSDLYDFGLGFISSLS
jgi:hypothetical protein